MSSPITTWEGAEAIFTYADKPVVIGFILLVAIAVTVLAVISSFKHENKSYIDYKE